MPGPRCSPEQCSPEQLAQAVQRLECLARAQGVGVERSHGLLEGAWGQRSGDLGCWRLRVWGLRGVPGLGGFEGGAGRG